MSKLKKWLYGYDYWHKCKNFNLWTKVHKMGMLEKLLKIKISY